MHWCPGILALHNNPSAMPFVTGTCFQWYKNLKQGMGTKGGRQFMRVIMSTTALDLQ